MARLLALLVLVLPLLAAEPASPPATAPLVLLKLDDLVRHGGDPKGTVSPRWQRTVDFLVAEGVKANLGLLCESLDGDCPGFVAWLKERQASGSFEIWNHGWYNRFPKDPAVEKQAEYLNRSAAEQTASIRRGQEAMLAKTGITMRAFGPHGTPPDANLHPALVAVPDIAVVWFYGPAKGATSPAIVLQRRAELEKPIFKPNPDNMRENWAKYRSFDYLAIQGHPNTWDDQGFAGFQATVRFLKEQGCRFVTVGEWLALQKRGK